MNELHHHRQLLSTMLHEGLDCLKLKTENGKALDDEHQRLLDYWTAKEGALYICFAELNNRIYQDAEMACGWDLNILASEDTLNTFVESGELCLVTVVGPKFNSIMVGAIDRHYLVGAFTKFDWVEDRTTIIDDDSIDFMFNSTVEPVMQKLAVNRLTNLLEECRLWNLADATNTRG